MRGMMQGDHGKVDAPQPQHGSRQAVLISPPRSVAAGQRQQGMQRRCGQDAEQ